MKLTKTQRDKIKTILRMYDFAVALNKEQKKRIDNDTIKRIEDVIKSEK